MKTYERNNRPDNSMTPEELCQIGEDLYGRWGWKRKLASALDKNENTIGRWTSGKSPIEPSEVMAIRSLIIKPAGNAEKTAWERISKANWERTLTTAKWDKEGLLENSQSSITFNQYRRLLMLMSRDSVWSSKYKGQIEIQNTENGLVAHFKSPDHFLITVQEANDFSGIDIIENLT